MGDILMSHPLPSFPAIPSQPLFVPLVSTGFFYSATHPKERYHSLKETPQTAGSWGGEVGGWGVD